MLAPLLERFLRLHRLDRRCARTESHVLAPGRPRLDSRVAGWGAAAVFTVAAQFLRELALTAAVERGACGAGGWAWRSADERELSRRDMARREGGLAGERRDGAKQLPTDSRRGDSSSDHSLTSALVHSFAVLVTLSSSSGPSVFLLAAPLALSSPTASAIPRPLELASCFCLAPFSSLLPARQLHRGTL